jgi:hypothetical protein
MGKRSGSLQVTFHELVPNEPTQAQRAWAGMKTKPARHLLAIDTATAWQSVALLQDEHVLALLEQDAEGSHARSLMGAIDRLLRGPDFR